MSLLEKLMERLGWLTQSNESDFYQNLAIKDLIFDWFNNEGLSIKEFENEILNPSLQLFNQKEFVASHIESNYSEYFDAMAIAYLASEKPKQEYLECVIKYKHENRNRNLLDFSRIRYRELASRPDLMMKFKTGESIIRAANAIHFKYDIVGNMNAMVRDLQFAMQKDHEAIFNPLIDYISQQDFLEKSYILNNAIPPSNNVDNKFSEASLATLKAKAESSIENDENTSVTKELAKAYKDVIIYYKELPAFKETEFKKQRFIGLKKCPEVLAFLQNFADQKESIIDLHLGNLNLNYVGRNEKKFFTEFAKALTKQLVVSDGKLKKYLAHDFAKNTEHIFDDLMVPIIEQSLDSLENPDKILGLLEQKIYQKRERAEGFYALKKPLNLAGQNSKYKDKPTLRKIYQRKYFGPYGLVNPENPYMNIILSDKKHGDDVVEDLQRTLNQVYPTSVKSISKHVQWLANITFNIDGKDYKFTNEIFWELNKVFKEKETGLRFVPVPISTFFSNGHTFLNCAYALLNYNEFQEFINVYLPEEFPQLIGKTILNEIQYQNTTAKPLTPVSMNSEETEGESLFLNDPSWKWFKDSYVDKLASKNEWYSLMNVIMKCEGSSKVNKKWLAEMDVAINTIGQERYISELGSMMSDSLKEDFWFIEAYRQPVKGIVWSCQSIATEDALSIIVSIVKAAYKKIPMYGPRSAAVGNLGLNALASSGNDLAFGMMNLMRNRSKYQRFIKAIDKYLEKFMSGVEGDGEIFADKSIPDFGFTNGEKKIEVSNKFSAVFLIKERKLSKQWMVNGELQRSMPSEIKSDFKAEEKEIAAEFKRINAAFKDVKARVKTFWLYDREWKLEDWKSYIVHHPLIGVYADDMIWMDIQNDHSFILSDGKFIDVEGREVSLASDSRIKLWHPILVESEEVNSWQTYIYQNNIKQPLRQAFREHYPFSSTELEGTDSMRFAHHFLNSRKLMAIAQSAGWIFTYAHQGQSWPRRFIKQKNMTVHLRCDYHAQDYATPSKEMFFTEGNTTKVEYETPKDRLQLSSIPKTTLSECCRDIDLFIATTSIANDPELSTESEDQKMYRGDFHKSHFSDNASASIRKEVIQILSPVLKIAPSFEKNYMIIEGKLNTYRINLGSGFAQIKDSQKHINLLPDIKPMKSSKKIQVPIEDDETLYIILAKALFLTKDDKIKDEKIRSMLV